MDLYKLMDRLRSAEDLGVWYPELLDGADSYEAFSIVHRFLTADYRKPGVVRAALEGLMDHAWTHITSVSKDAKEEPNGGC